jgi:hypothetical protein
MNKAIPALLLLAGSISFAQTIHSPPSGHSSAPEQSSFSAEDENVRHPVPVPPWATEILKRDADIKELMTNEHTRDLPDASLLASKIHLAGLNEEDLIVVGSGRLLGANVTPFWIFDEREMRLLLKARGHDLSIKNSRSKGYKDIEVQEATADRVSHVLFRFNGTGYEQSGVRTERIP